MIVKIRNWILWRKYEYHIGVTHEVRGDCYGGVVTLFGNKYWLNPEKRIVVEMNY